MAGIYFITTTGGWGYIGQTVMKNTVDRIADHVINGYEIPNFHSYSHGLVTPDNSGGLMNQVKRHGGFKLNYYMNENAEDCFGVGASSWDLFRQIWTQKASILQQKLDLAESAFIYIADRGSKYNTDGGGKSNFIYNGKILGQIIAPLLTNDKKLQKALINAFKEYQYTSHNKKQGLETLFTPEADVCNEVLKNFFSTTFLTEEDAKTIILDAFGSINQKEYIGGRKKKISLFDTNARASIKSRVQRVYDKFNKGVLDFSKHSTDLVDLSYFKINMNLNIEDIVDELYKQLSRTSMIIGSGEIEFNFPKTIKYNTKDISFTVDSIKPTHKPKWLDEAKLSSIMSDAYDEVRENVVTNYLRIWDKYGNNKEAIKPLFDNAGYIDDNFYALFDAIEEEYQRSKFGPLWFEPMYTKPGKVVFGRSLNPDIVYGEIYESEMQFMQSHIQLTIW